MKGTFTECNGIVTEIHYQNNNHVDWNSNTFYITGLLTASSTLSIQNSDISNTKQPGMNPNHNLNGSNKL